jgi:protein TonB
VPAPPILPRASQSGEADEGDALRRFVLELHRQLGKSVRPDRDYPRLAKQRGWQGKTIVVLQIDAAGKVNRIAVGETSGYDVLDDRALELVRRLQLPRIPDIWRGRPFEAKLNVRFTLKDGGIGAEIVQ